VKGTKLTVKRTDAGGRDGHGWGMSLRFYCTQIITKIPQDVTLGAFFYTNHKQGKMLMSQGNRHKWTTGAEKDGDTFCAVESKDDKNFVYAGYKFVRTSVKGVMNSANILKACKAMKMKPVCDKADGRYADGKCATIGGKWHFSHPSHNKKHKISVKKTMGAFFYCGNQNGGKSLMNTGDTHRWTSGRERDGTTFCVAKTASLIQKQAKFNLGGFTMRRVSVKGAMTSPNILKACKALKMVPVCNHGSYADGECALAGAQWHLSYPPHDRKHGLDPNVLKDAYFYTGFQYGGKRVLRNTGTTHVWSQANKDQDGDTYCTTVNRDLMSFNLGPYHVKRVKVEGKVTSVSIIKACKAEKMKPVCSHERNADGNCYRATTNWYLSHAGHDRSHGVSVSKVKGAFVYSAKQNRDRALMNNGVGHRWTDGRQTNGDTLCAKRRTPLPKTFKYNDLTMHRVRVKGTMNSANIREACKKVGMKPLCDHTNYFDGRCAIAGGNWHFSHTSHLRSHKLIPKKNMRPKKGQFDHAVVEGTYFYAGSSNRHKSLKNTWKGHRWSSQVANDRNGETWCTKPDLRKADFEFNGFNLKRVTVKGKMTSPNILKACAAVNMKPVCNHANYADGKCRLVGGAWYFSYPPHDRKYKVDTKKVLGAFFYCGKNNRGRVLYNNGQTHKWTNGREMDGDTFCTSRTESFKKNKMHFVYDKVKAHRIAVKGKMTNSNIIKACAAMKMRPICDHANYFDGQCLLVGGNWHFSHTQHAKKHNVPADVIRGAYFYTAQKRGVLQNTGNGHSWASADEADGDTFCAVDHRNKGDFKYRGFEFRRVRVSGVMNSANVLKACTAAKLKPVCNRANNADGHCRLVGGNWYFSYPSHNRQHKVPSKVKGAFFYSGTQKGNQLLFNIGYKHKWTNGKQRNGDTYCVERTSEWKKNKMRFRCKKCHYKGWIYRTAVSGPMTNSNLRTTCAKRGMRPLCDHANYFDGQCVLVNKNWHFSHPSHDRSHGIDVDVTRGAFFYTNNGERTLQNVGHTHQWTSGASTKEKNGDTFCVDYKPTKLEFQYMGFRMVRVPVKGVMNSANIVKACKSRKLKPACDKVGGRYEDGNCLTVGGNWHMSHPSHDRRHKVPLSKVTGSFFYSGKANGDKVLFNTGVTHKWTTGKERDGDTYCASPPVLKEFKYGKNKLVPVKITGKVNSANIAKACGKVKMRPVCDHASYADGTCILLNGNWHFSHPHHAKRRGINPTLTNNAYFYTNHRHGRALQSRGTTTHKWTTGKESGGTTFCTASNRDALSIKYKGHKLTRVEVKGQINSKSILRACKAAGLRPLCDHSRYSDGECRLLGENWHFSHPSHAKSRGLDVKKLRGAFFYCSNANGNKALLNTGTTHRWTDGRQRNGDTYCVERTAAFKKHKTTFTYHAQKATRVEVKGHMTASNIANACKKRGMMPICDHENYFDGRCLLRNRKWHFSHPSHAKRHRIPQDVVQGAYFYTNHGQGKVLQNIGNTHRWSNGRDKNGDTFCGRLKLAGMGFTFSGYKFRRVRVSGTMNKKNILKACTAAKLRPVCDHSHYADGQCEIVGGAWHFSHPAHNRQYKVPLAKTTGAFFYTNHVHGKVLYNTGSTHKWTNGRQADGYTYCVAKKGTTPTSFTYKKMKIYRTAVSGSVTNSNIRKACSKRGMRPVCDHMNYFDGQCVLANGNWHFSHPSHDKRHKIDVNIVKGAFFYTNNGERTLQNQATRHQWTTHGRYPPKGDTFCAQESSVNRDFVYNKYFKLKRLRVRGTMNSVNIANACTRAKMKPLCDHQSYSDGKCELLGGNWHFSHPSHNRRHKVPVENVQGSFFYCGNSNRGKSLMNTGKTHKWTTGRERGGYTFCVRRLRKFPNSFMFNGFKLSRTQFKGAATSSNLLRACRKRRMVPVCDHSSYANGECQMVGGTRSNWHISHGQHDKRHKLDPAKISGAYFYTANANHNRALQQSANGHRWTNNNDRNGGDTFCTTAPRTKMFKKGSYNLIRVKVAGSMTSPNIKRACNKKGMKPVCDHANYNDGNCVAVGGRWHFSHPSHNRRHKVPLSVVMNTYWYTNNRNRKSLWNRGDTHVWKPDSRRDANGYTFCTKAPKQIGGTKIVAMSSRKFSINRRNGATLKNNIAMVKQGSNFVETKEIFERPIDVSVQMRTTQSNECGVMAIFPQNGARHTGYNAGVGWWRNHFGAGVDGRIGRRGNNAGNNLRAWHTIRVNVAANGKVYFYINGQLRYTVRDNRYRSGRIRFGNGCRDFWFRNLVVSGKRVPVPGAMKIAMSSRKWRSYHRASFHAGIATVRQGSAYIQTKQTFRRPLDVSAKIRQTSGGNECGVMQLFPRNGARHTGYNAGVGWWRNHFGAGVDGRIGRRGNNAGNNLRAWHTVRINAAADGKVYFYINGQLRYSIVDNRYKSGHIRFGKGCRDYQIKDVQVCTGVNGCLNKVGAPRYELPKLLKIQGRRGTQSALMRRPMLGNAPRSIYAQIKTTALGNFAVVATGSPRPKQAFNLVSYSSRGRCIGVMGYGYDYFPKTCRNRVNDGKWHEVAAVYDGKKLKIYTDGKLQNTVTRGHYNTRGSGVKVGKSNHVRHENYFPGQIAGVRITSARKYVGDFEVVEKGRVTKVRPVRLLSQRKRTWQSSEGWSGRPSRAVDGNTNQRYPGRSCTHTQRHGRPWWKVNLGARYEIDKVQVWNRVDCCAGRLNRVQVKVDGRLCGQINRASRVNTINCRYKPGRSVMIQQTKSDYLTLCEVRVYGRSIQRSVRPHVYRSRPGPTRLLNLRRMRTWQSSEGWSGRPSRAVDGNTNQRYPGRSCTHTQRHGRPWWQLDLRKKLEVYKVQVWNRVDCCRNRLNGVQVRVDNKYCGSLNGRHSTSTVYCKFKRGRIIKLQEPRSDYLTICEVRVWARTPASRTSKRAAWRQGRIRDGNTVTGGQNRWSPYSNCPRGYVAISPAYIDLLGGGSRTNVNHFECTMRGCRVWITGGKPAVLKTRCVKTAASNVRDSPMITAPPNRWSAYAKCPSGFEAVGPSYIDILSGDINSDRVNVNHYECTKTACRVWITHSKAKVKTRCIKGATIVDAPRITTPANRWSGYSNCPSNSVALGLSYIDLLSGKNVNHQMCTKRGCRTWIERGNAKIQTRCLVRPGETLVVMGSQRRGKKSKTVSMPAGYKCAPRVSRANWANRGRHRRAPDVFTVRQSGSKVTVTRIDHGGRHGGWGMNLMFKCYNKDIKKSKCSWSARQPWNKALSKGAYRNKDVGAACFNKAFWASKNKIVKRVCRSCHPDYRVMYYRRYTKTKSFPVYDYLKMNWKSSNNVLNRDFGIFSSYGDALRKRNPWRFCNYNDPGIGFPRDCGKRRAVGGQWNSWRRGGKQVAYYIEGPRGARVPKIFGVRKPNRIAELARRKRAYQSSEGWSGRPSRAVDGNTNQRYPGRSCTHTQRHGRPWWKVDLRANFRVQKVMIWNRVDCCANRLGGVYVKLNNRLCGRVSHRPGRVNTVSCRNRVGRWIMIQQSRSDYLTLCEVRVYGARHAVSKPRRGRRSRVALLSQRKPTRQSSEGWSGRPSRAVDGNTNQHYGRGSCTHTQRHGRPWWRVDLQRRVKVQKVMIWNRVDCCASRLNRVEVKVDGHRCGIIHRASRVNTMYCRWKAGRFVWVRQLKSDYLTLCEVRVYGSPVVRAQRAGPVHLLSQRKRTWQSSEGWSGRPSRAVDGNTNQRYPGRSCTHTQRHGHPWWRVDLGRRYQITKVQIWNRSDCCASRLNRVRVRVDGRQCGWINRAHSFNSVSCNRAGRQVMIQQMKSDYLTLCEVRVYGRSIGRARRRRAPSRLISQRRPARQSSEGWSGRPSRAVDGNTNQHYGRGSCTHTQRHGRPWWKVYLSRSYRIDRVSIWNRVDCCRNRLNGVYVKAGNHVCGRYPGSRGHYTMSCRGRIASHVTIQQSRSDYLTLCEVRVYGRPAGAAPKRVTYTPARGGNGGGAVHSYCRSGKHINYWRIRSGSLVDSLQGRCSDGRWLRRCGGRGGGFWQGHLSTQQIWVRTGALVDKFNHRGGNGGGRHLLSCRRFGSQFRISGYRLRCGALVDKVQFQCRN
jgi:hypothetical protein